MTACPRCETAIEDGDLRCAICALPVAAAARTGDDRPRAQVLRCGECGAAVGFSAEAQAPRCGFCGATMAIEHPVDPVETARRQLAFSVDRDAAAAALRGWLATRGSFAPRALSREAVLEALTPVAWAAWLVNADARVTWTADSEAGAQRSAWAPHAGEASLGFRDIIVPASRGLREAECRRLIPHYDLSRVAGSAGPGEASRAGGDAMSDAMSEAMSEAMIERFDVQRSAARAYVQDRIAALAKVRIEPQIPGRRHRNVHVACLLERQTTDRIALPAWVLAYRYRGTAYRAIVHGQRPEVVLGAAPIDWGKVGRLVALLAAIAAIVAWVVLTHGAI